jgi:hypothetical protein
MVLSSRDRRLVDVYMVWLGPSLERRRLRFSFQFNDVKDPDRLSPAPLFSAGGRRRRRSRGRPLSCQPILSDFYLNLGKSEIRRKYRSRAAEGLPSLVQRFDWRGELSGPWWKDQGVLSPGVFRQRLCPPKGGGCLGASPEHVNQTIYECRNLFWHGTKFVTFPLGKSAGTP